MVPRGLSRATAGAVHWGTQNSPAVNVKVTTFATHVLFFFVIFFKSNSFPHIFGHDMLSYFGIISGVSFIYSIGAP